MIENILSPFFQLTEGLRLPNFCWGIFRPLVVQNRRGSHLDAAAISRRDTRITLLMIEENTLSPISRLTHGLKLPNFLCGIFGPLVVQNRRGSHLDAAAISRR